MPTTIIGTGHVIKKSVDDVDAAISEIQPDVVALELDFKRFRMLEEAGWDLESHAVGWTEVLSGISRGNFSLIFQKILGDIQRELGKNWGVAAGSDMRSAVFAARKLGKDMVLIDRDIAITLNHLFSIPLSEKIKLFGIGGFSGLDSDIMESISHNLDSILEEKNISKVMSIMREKTPNLYNAMVDERDLYMANFINRIQKDRPEASIVAVVGAGHKTGIEKYLNLINSGEEISMKPVLEIRKTNFLSTIPLIFGAALSYIAIKAIDIFTKIKNKIHGIFKRKKKNKVGI